MEGINNRMRISLTLSVRGDLLDPDQITTVLGVMPHVSRKKGELRVTGGGKEIVSKTGVWEWWSRDASEKFTLDEHVERITHAFKNTQHLLSKLPGADTAWIDIHIVEGDGTYEVPSVSFVTSHQALLALSQLGLPLEVTIDVVPIDGERGADAGHQQP